MKNAVYVHLYVNITFMLGHLMFLAKNEIDG